MEAGIRKGCDALKNFKRASKRRKKRGESFVPLLTPFLPLVTLLRVFLCIALRILVGTVSPLFCCRATFHPLYSLIPARLSLCRYPQAHTNEKENEKAGGQRNGGESSREIKGKVQQSDDDAEAMTIGEREREAAAV